MPKGDPVEHPSQFRDRFLPSGVAFHEPRLPTPDISERDRIQETTVHGISDSTRSRLSAKVRVHRPAQGKRDVATDRKRPWIGSIQESGIRKAERSDRRKKRNHEDREKLWNP